MWFQLACCSTTGGPDGCSCDSPSTATAKARNASTASLALKERRPDCSASITWFSGSRGEDKGLSTTPLQRAILRELCLGRTQAQAAKNLGVGPAWINEQLSQLRKKVGVGTLNELIYWWAKSPNLDVPD
ncbi:helix-turn-helix transcriptional regulator [Streptomyces sp. NPDC001315]|uniref:helix-turn-helix transcriptional regulator n=1 Tax=Streptomyces sp. NPDC001315 TaxID=3364562 RepID=UPI0036792BAD